MPALVARADHISRQKLLIVTVKSAHLEGEGERVTENTRLEHQFCPRTHRIADPDACLEVLGEDLAAHGPCTWSSCPRASGCLPNKTHDYLMSRSLWIS